jgi:hypothetical protein
MAQAAFEINPVDQALRVWYEPEIRISDHVISEVMCHTDDKTQDRLDRPINRPVRKPMLSWNGLETNDEMPAMSMDPLVMEPEMTTAFLLFSSIPVFLLFWSVRVVNESIIFCGNTDHRPCPILLDFSSKLFFMPNQ